MSITVFLVDDHAIVRDGLRLILEAEGDIEVVGHAANGREAVHQVPQLRPDVVVMDIAMPEMNGTEATQQIRETCPSTQIVILSMHNTTEYAFHALRAGARGYLLKESAGVEVVKAVRVVHAGHRYLSQKILDKVIDDYVRQREAAEAMGPLVRLTPREREVLQLVAEGNSSTEIAEALSVSRKTIDTYRSRITRKLGISDIPGLVRFAIRSGLIPLE